MRHCTWVKIGIEKNGNGTISVRNVIKMGKIGIENGHDAMQEDLNQIPLHQYPDASQISVRKYGDARKNHIREIQKCQPDFACELYVEDS